MKRLTHISHQFACRHRLVVCCQYVMRICSLYRHYRLRLFIAPIPGRNPAGGLRRAKSAILPICLACLFAASEHMLPQPYKLPGADLDIRRMPAGGAPWMGRINYGYVFGRRHPLAAQICQEQIWTSVWRPQGVRQGRRTSKILRDHRINW